LDINKRWALIIGACLFLYLRVTFCGVSD